MLFYFLAESYIRELIPLYKYKDFSPLKLIAELLTHTFLMARVYLPMPKHTHVHTTVTTHNHVGWFKILPRLYEC